MGTTVFLAAILFGPASAGFAGCLMFALGFANASYALAFPLVESRVERPLAPAALGFANMMVMGLGGWLFQPLVGLAAGSDGAPGSAVLSVFLVAQLVAIGLLAVDRRCVGLASAP